MGIFYFKEELSNYQYIGLLFAIITSISLIKKIRKKFKKKNLLLFIIFITLGLIYFAGEEINWGQHWFYWEANKFFETYNDQYITFCRILSMSINN